MRLILLNICNEVQKVTNKMAYHRQIVIAVDVIPIKISLKIIKINVPDQAKQ